MSENLTDAPILMTGFPGFLSDHLIAELTERTSAPFHFLSLPKTVGLARRRLEEMEQELPDLAGRWQVHAGDIAEPRLGLSEKKYAELAKEIGVVWHLAAIYDLAVPKEIAYRVNVGGTSNILEFCERCDDFQRLNYVSTCYVAGERTGTIYENELDAGQHHKNHYEGTKFWAEVEVQRRWDRIPTAIFRPGIVVGNSQTGETSKYDGPYYIFQLLHRLPEWMPVPNVGGGDALVNLVPIDFVTRALAELGHNYEEAEGTVFHIADPQPMTAKQIVDRVLEVMDRRKTLGSLPAKWVERALANSTVEEWTGVPREALTYFNHDARYDTTNATSALQKLDIQAPHLSSYLNRLVEFFLRHPDGPPSIGATQSPGQDGADDAAAAGDNR